VMILLNCIIMQIRNSSCRLLLWMQEEPF
jgi:hypothetical protein